MVSVRAPNMLTIDSGLQATPVSSSAQTPLRIPRIRSRAQHPSRRAPQESILHPSFFHSPLISLSHSAHWKSWKRSSVPMDGDFTGSLPVRER